MKLRIHNIFIGILLVAGQAVQAQDLPAGTDLDSVIILDNRLRVPLRWQNRNIGIIDRQEIAALPVRSVNELLSYMAGVDLRQRGPNGTQADISIDGSTFDQVLVLINGVKISDPQTGHNMLSLNLPVSVIDHIEVLRGPAARVYGVNALAGAVNIVTRRPEGNEVFAQAYGGSSFQQDTASGDTYYNYGVQATAGMGGEKHDHLLSVSHDKGNGYRYNTAYEAYRLYYQNSIRIHEKHSLEAMGAYTSNEFGANAFYSAPGDREATEAVQAALGAVSYSWKPAPNVRITPRVSYRYGKDDYIYTRRNPSLYHNIHETNVVTGEVQSAIGIGKGTLGIGAEWRYEAIVSNNLGRGSRENTGLYAEYRQEIIRGLNASAGLYGNYNSIFGWQVFPGADIGYQISDSWKLFAAGSTGQRLPTFTDLYYNGPGNRGNALLQPEVAAYGEAGFSFQRPWLRMQGSYYYRQIREFIDWVRELDTDPWQARNFQAINTSGYTVQATWFAARQVKLPEAFQAVLNLNYTYIDQQIASDGNAYSQYAIQALRHQFTARLTGLLFRRVELNLAGRYLYRISGNDYTVLDARLGYRLKQVLIYTDINNILDAQYRETGAVPMPGRWVSLGVRWQGGF